MEDPGRAYACLRGVSVMGSQTWQKSGTPGHVRLVTIAENGQSNSTVSSRMSDEATDGRCRLLPPEDPLQQHFQCLTMEEQSPS
jgi:hypothetical protein